MSSSSVPARSAVPGLGAVSLLVKRLEQRVRLVDQLLNALRRRIFVASSRSDAQRYVRKRGAESGDSDSEADPEEDAAVRLRR